MADRIVVDPVGLALAADQVTELGRSVAAVLAGLDQRLLADDGCWGTDEVGTAFANGYLPAQEGVRRLLGGTRDGLFGLAAALGQLRGEFESADSSATEPWQP